MAYGASIGGGFDAQLARMMAEHEINSERANRELIKGLHTQAQGDIQLKNLERENANGMASAMATVGIVMSAVKVASSAQNVGETTQKTGELQQGMQQAQGGNLDALKEVRLPGNGGDRVDTQVEHMLGGRQGMTVGERFTDQQLGVLTGSTDIRGLTDADLKGMGFSDREVTELRGMQENGISADEGVHFMMTHGSPETRFGASQMEVITRDGPITETDDQLRERGFTNEQIADLRRLSADGGMSNEDTAEFLQRHGARDSVNGTEMARAAFMKALTETLPDRLVTNAQEKAKQQAKASDADKEVVLEVASGLRDDISKFAESLQQIELQALERKGGQNQSRRS